MNCLPSKKGSCGTDNHRGRLQRKKLMRKLAEYSHCSAPDEKVILLKVIQRIEILQHVNEILEDQVQTLIRASVQKDTSSEFEHPT